MHTPKRSLKIFCNFLCLPMAEGDKFPLRRKDTELFWLQAAVMTALKFLHKKHLLGCTLFCIINSLFFNNAASYITMIVFFAHQNHFKNLTCYTLFDHSTLSELSPTKLYRVLLHNTFKRHKMCLHECMRCKRRKNW